MIRRTLSVPVLVLSVAGLAAAGTAFHYGRQWQLSRLSQSLLDRARASEQREQWRAAAEDLDRYLRFQPQQPAVRCRLAALFARSATTLEEKQQAVALHYRALASQTEDDRSLRASLAELLLDTGRLLEAESEARPLVEQPSPDPRAAKVFALARYLQWSGGELAAKTPQDLRLLADLENALKLNPADIALAETAATVYRDSPAIVDAYREEHGQPRMLSGEREQKADSLLDKAVERNPRSGKAHLARHLYRARYQLDGAARDLELALSLAPEDPQILLMAAEAHFQRAREALAGPDGEPAVLQSAITEHPAAAPLQAAKDLLKRLLDNELAPDKPQPHLRLGDVLVLEGALGYSGGPEAALDEAIQVWQSGLAKFAAPTVQVAFHARIADHLINARRIAESQPSLDAIQKILDDLGGMIRREDHLVLRQAQGLRRAAYQLCNGRYSEAVGELQLAIARQPQIQPDPETAHAAWDLLGRGYAGLQDWAAAATAFDRAANFKPQEVAARLSAAEAWLSAGRTDLAIDRAEQVLHSKGLLEAWLVLGTAHLQIQALLPKNERTWDDLDRALKNLTSQPADSLAAPWRVDFLQADCIALRAEGSEQDHQQAAAEVLRRAELKYEDRPEFWFQACLAYERLALPQDAQRAWQRLSRLPGAEADAAIVASRRAVAVDDYAQAERILESAAAALPVAAQERLRQEMVLIARARQDLPKLQALYSAALRERPHDVGALCGLAELALRAADYTALEQWEHKLREAGTAGHIWARYFRVTRLFSSARGRNDQRLQDALAEQSQLATLRPNWSETYSLRGAIEQRLENWPQAAAAYEQAVQLGERRYAIFEQLIACLDKAQRPDDIDKYMARMESYLPASQRLTEIASTRHLDENEPERAIEIARRALAKRPHDVAAQLWLARLLLVTGNLPEAKASFERAAQAAPDDARTWSGLFAYYLRAGDSERARAALESLRQHAKLDSDERDFLLSRAYHQLGDVAAAERLLMSLVQRSPDLPEAYLQLAKLQMETNREQSKQHLRRALELDPKLAQARWLLAALLAAGGSPEDLEAAEQLLEETGGPVETIEDRRVRALLLAQHGGDSGLARAIRLLEDITRESPAGTTDRLLLAQLLERRAAATTDEQESQNCLNAAREQLLTVAGRTKSQPSDIGVLVSFLLRRDDRQAEAGIWLDRLEERISSQATADPAAIAMLIELRIQQGAAAQCEAWVARLEAIDRDPLRPLALRVKYLAALPKPEAIEPAIESRAATLLKRALSLKEQGRIARVVGDLYLMVNQLTSADRWYRLVVRDDPEEFPLLALALVRQGRGREAIGLCQTAAEHDQSSRPYVVLTSLLLESGAKREYMEIAGPMLAAGLSKFPNDANLAYGVGMLRVLEDRYPEAVPLLHKVVQLNPRHVPALNNLAMIVAQTPDNRQEALDLVERAIAYRGNQPTLLDTKGTILLWAGRTDEAKTLLEAAARGFSNDPRHSFHLAMAYSELGDTGQAEQQLAAALQQNLDKQILTPTDRRQLAALQAALNKSGRER